MIYALIYFLIGLCFSKFLIRRFERDTNETVLNGKIGDMFVIGLVAALWFVIVIVMLWPKKREEPMKIHPEKDFCCQKCGKGFNSLDALGWHISECKEDADNLEK